MSKPGVLAEPVLVGRTRELEQLYRYLELAASGRITTLFVSGEAGLEKQNSSKLKANQ